MNLNKPVATGFINKVCSVYVILQSANGVKHEVAFDGVADLNIEMDHSSTDITAGPGDHSLFLRDTEYTFTIDMKPDADHPLMWTVLKDPVLEEDMPKTIYTSIQTRSDAFPREGGKVVAASVPGYSRIPFNSGTVTLIGVDGNICYAKTVEEMRELSFSHSHILVCWPGKYSQDIFYVDDVDALRERLGLKLASKATKFDREGREWLVASV